MDIADALKEQYHAGLAMLAECVEKCPEDLWLEGEAPRTFWQIALHAAFFTHYYLAKDEAAYAPWPDRPAGRHDQMWLEPAYVEPFELPEGTEHYSRAEVLAFIAYVDGLVDPVLEGIDLDAEETGFGGYPAMGKLSHELMSLRHIQGHVGQLSERLMARGIDIDWIGKGRRGDWKRWEGENP